MKKILVMGMVIVAGLCGAANNEFVTTKKKKKPSAAALKEECCRASGDLLATIPDVLTALADIQTVCLETVSGALEGDAGSFCERASKHDLAVYKEQVEKLHTHLLTIQHELAQTTERLRTQIAQK